MLKLMDCTLRDGANVVGTGFSAKLTKMMIEGLIESNIKIIELGCAYGIGANIEAPLKDSEYLELIAPYRGQAELGMFLSYFNGTKAVAELAKSGGLDFLRVGANAGDGEKAKNAVRLVKNAGLFCRYSLMKGYILSADKLAEEAKMLEDCGVDEITIMDSAGTMMPDEVSRYVVALKNTAKIPVAFHGHNNLGLSTANAIAAVNAGVDVLDCGLMGMARSAGNLATEAAVAVMQRQGQLQYVDFYKLLHFIDENLSPEMYGYGYKSAISVIDLVYGLSGCHSSFAKLFADIADESGVDLYRLIIETSAIDRKAPTAELIKDVASKL